MCKLHKFWLTKTPHGANTQNTKHKAQLPKISKIEPFCNVKRPETSKREVR